MADGGEKAKEWSTNWDCDWEFLQQLLPQGWQGKARDGCNATRSGDHRRADVAARDADSLDVRGRVAHHGGLAAGSISISGVLK